MVSTMLRSRLTRAQRLGLALAWISLLAVVSIVALPTSAKEKRGQLPAVNNFATARFKLLTTTEGGGEQGVAFGGGAVVLPDRTQVWLGSNDSPELIDIIQIGPTIYMRVGDKPWEKSENAPVGNEQAQPVSAQFNALQQSATAILDLGEANAGDVPTHHYQVWLSGAKALELAGGSTEGLPDEFRDLIEKSAFKYDFWVGTQDGFLHQQMTSVMLPKTKIGDVEVPELTTTSLVTFYSINDPNISVNAPI
ncbi:MAG TPA: hypothetical protein VFX76_16765 [Roseiflexaceae bacterium]|nr:hypothetical protein [Roseiflexaceae bacterium]